MFATSRNRSLHFIAYLAIAFVAGCTLLLSPATVHAASLSVPGSYSSIDAALSAAQDGDTIAVGDGTYECTITLDKRVNLVGSGSGVSVLFSDMSHPVITVESGGTGSIISSLTITDGRGTVGGGISCVSGSPIVSNCRIVANAATLGGGIGCGPSLTPTITNCVIAENSAVEGGGIYCGSAMPRITNCTVTANNGLQMGGGIFCSTALPVITNCILSGNSGADLVGGSPDYCSFGVSVSPIGDHSLADIGPSFESTATHDYRLRWGSPLIDAGTGNVTRWVDGTHVAFAAPTTDIGGVTRPQGSGWDIGAYETLPPADVYVSTTGDDANDGSEAHPYLTMEWAVGRVRSAGTVHVGPGTFPCNVVLDRPVTVLGSGSVETTLHGGGLGNVIQALAGSGDSTITGLTVAGGYGGSYGAGILCQDASPSFANCVIADNGGYMGGGVACLSSAPSFTNCVFARNFAYAGAGIYSWQSSPVIKNCTFYRNSGGPGRSVHNQTPDSDTSVVSITNCIVWGGAGELQGCSASYSDVSDAVDAGVGNISVAPGFVDTEAGDYRLATGSPCVDQATSTAAPATDILGVSRPQGLGVDMGAYEQSPAMYSLTYHAGVNGSLAGDATQTVGYPGAGTAVLAKADEGYHFVAWSDGRTDAGRTDSVLHGSIEVTPSFAVDASPPPVPSGYAKLGVVRFVVRSARLTPAAKASLRAYARAIAAGGLHGVRVDGYTSKRPDGGTTWKANLALSQARGRAVRLYLVARLQALGARPSVTSIGLGNTNAVSSNRTKGGQAANRRAEVWVR